MSLVNESIVLLFESIAHNIVLFFIFFIYCFIFADDDSFASERDAQSADDSVTSFVFNAHHSLAIEAQRERLPIRKYRDHLLYCVEQFQTVILVGETGCGKSTQIPQVCYQQITTFSFSVDSNVQLECLFFIELNIHEIRVCVCCHN